MWNMWNILIMSILILTKPCQYLNKNLIVLHLINSYTADYKISVFVPLFGK
jgi:hypothetical protein